MRKTAAKTNPTLWKKVVSKVKASSKGGPAGRWSARKAQLAVLQYKKAGGGYKGAKSSQNDLTKWTKQEWGYVTKSDEKKPRSQRGRYLPKKVRKSLSSSEKASTNQQKRAANKKGAAKAKYSKSVAKKVRKA